MDAVTLNLSDDSSNCLQLQEFETSVFCAINTNAFAVSNAFSVVVVTAEVIK